MERYYKKYARLMLQAGINLQLGQKIHVQLEPYHWPFAKVLVDEAYKLGASYVLLEATDPCVLASRINHGAEEDLAYIPPWIEERNRVMAEEKWPRLFFFGSTDPDLMGTLDQKRLTVVQTEGRKASKIISRACGAGEIAWAGAALPTPKWAQQVFPDHSPKEALELLWQEIATIVQLDHDDPSQIWQEIGSSLKTRGNKLADLQLKTVHFKGPGTDLKVDCLPHSIWAGGASTSTDGVDFIPNIPTFENFTTPDFRYTEGKVTVTCPIEVLGSVVSGAWFEFKEGKVINYGAYENIETLEKMFSICPQAAYLGELALVDGSSPIYHSGKTFYSGLFDENATCHIALGNGYVTAAAGAQGKTDKELLEMGVNVSLLHHDFMIGSNEVDVDGITEEGTRIPLIRKGLYTEILRYE